LGEIICNPDAVGMIAKWFMELMDETLAYAPRKAIKSQILADFVAEWTDVQLPPLQIQAECWTLYFDGSVMKTGAGAGLLFVSPLGGAHEIRGMPAFPRVQQHGGVRGPPLRPLNHRRNRHQALRRQGRFTAHD
jgi:hypothetical protein